MNVTEVLRTPPICLPGDVRCVQVRRKKSTTTGFYHRSATLRRRYGRRLTRGNVPKYAFRVRLKQLHPRYFYYLSLISSVCLTSKPFTIFSMLFKSLGELAASGLGDAVFGLSGGDSDPPLILPEGELLKLLVWELGVTVSKALPRGEELTPELELGRVYGVNLWPPFRWLCMGEVGDKWWLWGLGCAKF